MLTDGAGAAECGRANPAAWRWWKTSERGDFLARLAELQADASAVGEVSGFNYSRGRKVHVTLYRVAQLRDCISHGHDPDLCRYPGRRRPHRALCGAHAAGGKRRR